MDRLPASTLWPTLRWEYAAPGHQGVSGETLREMAAHLQRVFPPFGGLVVVRNGCIVFEAENERARASRASGLVRGALAGATHLSGCPRATFQDRIDGAWNLHSATRSVLSLLVGIAFKKGLLRGLDDRAFDYLPETRAMRFPAAKREITLRHLLTMTSGLRSLDSGPGLLRLLFSRNWLRTCLQLPLQDRPGGRARHNAANAHLLSAILARVSGHSTAEFARRYLFEPLGISPATWEADPQGVTFGSGNLFLSLVDMARIGYLALNQGCWESQEILPEWYLRDSLGKQQSFDLEHSYGFLWHLHDETWQDRPLRVISAIGTGGQRILVVPALNLVVAAACRMDFAAERSALLDQAFSEYLFPAIGPGF